MVTNRFMDYYKILQVHYDASPEIIQAAYKRLSRIYHPDNGSITNEYTRMVNINLAFETLSNTAKRNDYHKQWLEHFSDRASYVKTRPVQPDGNHQSALEAMEDFFLALKRKQWETAYLILTEEDKANAFPDEFTEWKEAVDHCYEMQEYNIKYYKTYYNCSINNVIYASVIEFAVTVTDMDRQTCEYSTEVLHKYAAFDGVSWKVCLGKNSLKQSTLRFRLLADRKKNFNPFDIYHNAVSNIDPLTGLLSESGFYQEAAKEAARTKRYHNPFSLIAFRIICDNTEKESQCLCNISSIIKNNLRINDFAAHLKDNFLICLLAETRLNGASAASKKFIKLINNSPSMSFHINVGILEFKEHQILEDAVYSVCSKASIENNVLHL